MRLAARTGGSRRTRSAADRMAGGGVMRSRAVAASAPQVLEQARLELLRADAARRRDETADLAASHETSSAQLDALELSASRPRPDRCRAELHVRCVEDRSGLGESDPVRSGPRHR